MNSAVILMECVRLIGKMLSVDLDGGIFNRIKSQCSLAWLELAMAMSSSSNGTSSLGKNKMEGEIVVQDH